MPRTPRTVVGAARVLATTGTALPAAAALADPTTASPATASPATAAPTAASSAPRSSTPASPLTTIKGHLRGNGDLFLTPTSAAGTGTGAQIVDRSGRTVWFHHAARGTVDADFSTQQLDGKRVLTFWEGTGFGGLSNGSDYVYADHYHLIAEVHVGHGLTTDSWAARHRRTS